MNTIWNDREVKIIIDGLRAKLRRQKASSEKDRRLCAPRFVFVCGKSFKEKGNTIRKVTIKRLGEYKNIGEYKNTSSNVLCVISEDLYGQEYSEDLFSFEKMLAEISQCIIIPVESAGTYCELGAFAMDKDCFLKTTVINEYNVDYLESFISKGPIKMLEDSDKSRVIWYNGNIEDNIEYLDRIKEIATHKIEIPINEDYKKIKIRSLIYELANIIEIFQPLTPYEVECLYKRIKGFDVYTLINDSTKIKDIKAIVKFMEKMGLITNDGSNNYRMSDGFSCYNALFTLSRKEYIEIRIRYLNRLKKYRK